jgi:hypothetical protein
VNTDHLIVCILGMHRSGTSCLTGSLQQAGLRLGKYHSWNRYNQKGNRENQDFVDFHEDLLAANGASWDRPPRRLKFDKEDCASARELLARFSGLGSWGFKDPRALLALELWREADPELHYVGIFRHPRAVAESLRRRAGGRITIERGMHLWYHYNRLLYRAWKEHRFPMLCFDWEEQEFHRRLEPVVRELGLPGGKRFYASDLLHFEARRWEGIPWRIRRLYHKLEAACEQSPEQPRRASAAGRV